LKFWQDCQLLGIYRQRTTPHDWAQQKMIGKKVLLIDDDHDLLELSKHILKGAGAQVITAREGSEGIGKLFIHQPDLILLDIVMPEMNGLEVCQKIRMISNAPLMILTALDQEQNMLQAFELGADDFLPKPFSAQVLLARANALLRRSRSESKTPPVFKYNDGHLAIATERHQVLINGRSVKCGPTEFRLLVYLERNAGKVLTYAQLLANVWGEEYRGNVDIVHVYISMLRSKIEKIPKHPSYIQSIHGVGYIFERQQHSYDNNVPRAIHGDMSSTSDLRNPYPSNTD
jgi:two-component system alkaline phosphatase synthesis response regulator PhoP